MWIVKFRKFFFVLTGLLVAGAIASTAYFGLPLSIEFTGGTLTEVSYTATVPTLDEVKSRVETLSLDHPSIRTSGETAFVLRTQPLSVEQHQALLQTLSNNGADQMTMLRHTSIGPTLGKELATKAFWAVLMVILSIVLYIAFAFRKVSKPVSSFTYGIIVVLVLVHDVIVPVGFYSILGAVTGAQVDTLAIVAILAILGYSVNDTIVIFDRVREHLKHNEDNSIQEKFDITVGKSIDETMGRSINTSLTVVLALTALVFVGAPATFNFALVLLVGVIAGTYSSIMFAAPLLVPLAAKAFKKK
jgi:preprotein translocase subunit SecF